MDGTRDADYERLIEVLSRCSHVTKLDPADKSQAATLAHAFVDLADSFRRVIEDQLPRLMAGPPDSEATFDLLIDIGEELRHVLYHIYDPEFYSYLPRSDSEAGAQPRTTAAYAIVRVDNFHDGSVTERNRVTVKRIVWNQETAEAEVQRLNALHADKACEYFWQSTQVDP